MRKQFGARNSNNQRAKTQDGGAQWGKLRWRTITIHVAAHNYIKSDKKEDELVDSSKYHKYRGYMSIH